MSLRPLSTLGHCKGWATCWTPTTILAKGIFSGSRMRLACVLEPGLPGPTEPSLEPSPLSSHKTTDISLALPLHLQAQSPCWALSSQLGGEGVKLEGES